MKSIIGKELRYTFLTTLLTCATTRIVTGKSNDWILISSYATLMFIAGIVLANVKGFKEVKESNLHKATLLEPENISDLCNLFVFVFDIALIISALILSLKNFAEIMMYGCVIAVCGNESGKNILYEFYKKERAKYE